MIHIIDKHNCSGCSACEQKCPKQCISMREDGEGFLYPVVNEAGCIGCGLCEAVCPWLQNGGEQAIGNAAFAVKNRDEADRMASSSGGVFVALAKDMISKGGVVFGAVFDEHWEVRHTYVETLDGVRPMMGSKYVQSRTEGCFRDVERFLRKGRKVLFVGTPCQVAGLHGFLRKAYDNLLTVDFLCHGVPSPGVWRKYLDETVSRSADSATMIKSIDFRDKRPSGWERYSFVVRGTSASKPEGDAVLLSDLFFNNPFMLGFIKDIYLRPSCYRCKCKLSRSKSDITLADYWGVDGIMPDFADDRGVSLVFVNTGKGRFAFCALDVDARPADLTDLERNNGGVKLVVRENRGRRKFFRLLSSGRNFYEALDAALRKPFYRRACRSVRKALTDMLTK